MKLFQIYKGLCYRDVTTEHPTLQSTVGCYPPSVLFVETPDYVFQDWGYDDTQEGDARFIEPIPPEGWLYDPETGTFYENPDYTPPVSETEDMLAALTLLGVEPEEG